MNYLKLLIPSVSIICGYNVIAQNQRPNIILIMSDDMGFSDLGCYGGEIETPNLDNIAEEGVRFTQFYNSARSCPTRASLITGLYPHQTGIGHMTNDPENPVAFDIGLYGYRGFLNNNSVTFAEVLKDAGYNTLMTGKWHVGMHEKSHWPLQRGFDRFYGILAGASNFFKPVHPRGITLDNKQIEISDPDYYTTDAFTDYAIEFIDDTRSKNDNPFFLYLAYNAPHWPLQAPQDVVDKYKDKYLNGWEEIRKTRYEKLKEIGIIEDQHTLPIDDASRWDKLADEKKREMDLRMAIYAAQVDHMDTNIGKLVDYLKSEGIFDNTLIIFINDNGACAEGGMLGGGPASQLETKEGYFLSYGQSWANASNSPLRMYKHWVHEGGISSPCIVSWPTGISEELKGQLIKQYGFLPDLMATFIDVADTKYPKKYKGNKIHSLVGKSFLPQLKGSNKPIHKKPIFWEHEGNRAVRLGDYKLVMRWEGKDEDNWELYNIKNDRTEVCNLAKEYPKKVEKMKNMWFKWAMKTHVEPDWSEIVRLEKLQRK